ncbi:DUF4833 domain-containing protein [Dyadobacter sp. CY347]|uniref:DUF4833 domain-containing protein n=1 Tax=Dyadobacter sp. CY347 TaxID=2909336 RepID=UPI001F4141F4|nr:DUF4833 domain-containing protein [Dyadobacter sp. CY347]MCF2487734.1 DUF4833 domain-containing protein [Dyadobacter sp. CY347]
MKSHPTNKVVEYLLILFLTTYVLPGYAQEGYPVPPFNKNRLFYIQHSKNHNTFVYDAFIQDGNIQADKPVNVYKIAYTEKGKRTPLTLIQRKFAFGIKSKRLSANVYEMQLAASKKVTFYLNLVKSGMPKVHVTVNNRKMFLDRIFLKIKEGTSGIKVKLDYALFYGTDFDTGQNIIERTVPKE